MLRKIESTYNSVAHSNFVFPMCTYSSSVFSQQCDKDTVFLRYLEVFQILIQMGEFVALGYVYDLL